jgi:hypothetical protein
MDFLSFHLVQILPGHVKERRATASLSAFSAIFPP